MSRIMNGLSLIFCIISVVSLLVVNYYPTGDWMTAPLVTLIFGIPIVVVQVLLCLLVIFWRRGIVFMIPIQGLLGMLCLAGMYHYIHSHHY